MPNNKLTEPTAARLAAEKLADIIMNRYSVLDDSRRSEREELIDIISEFPILVILGRGPFGERPL